MEKMPENKIGQEISPQEEYLGLLGTYKEDFHKIKKLQDRFQRGSVDKESSAVVSEADQKRHETHLKLIELGRKLGKDKESVLVDIIRGEGGLEEYGLPEFSILIENDIIDTGYWHNPYDFNVNTEKLRPGTKIKTEPKSFYSDEGKSFIGSDEIMIVFAIVPIENYGEGELNPEDYNERVRRANALAKEVGGKTFEERDTGYHEASAKILGVIVPKKDLEKIAAIIRNNPDKYRLGAEFYSDEAKKKTLLHKANSIIKEITGAEGELKKLPEPIKEAEVLKEKTIVLVDDDEVIFEYFVPHLLVATEGRAIFILHTNQKEKDVIKEVLESGADIVLLDQNLSIGTKGDTLARGLKEKGFTGVIIGFSADKRVGKLFRDAGALGAVEKDPDHPEDSILKIVKILPK